jgi:hypothetical protein
MTTMSFRDYDRDPEKEIFEEILETNENAGFLEEDFMYQAASASAASASADGGLSQLSERDQAILGFERQWWKYSGAKEAAIRELFDMSSTRYYQLINTLIDTPEALEFDPMLVKRLRRMRSSRQAARTANRANIR